MTRERLSQLSHLNGEIVELTEKLAELELERQLVGECGAAALDRRSGELRCRLRHAVTLRDEIMDFISSIDDSFVRRLIYYRYIKCRSWVEIARIFGSNNSPDCLRMIVMRALKRKNIGAAPYGNIKEQGVMKIGDVPEKIR